MAESGFEGGGFKIRSALRAQVQILLVAMVLRT